MSSWKLLTFFSRALTVRAELKSAKMRPLKVAATQFPIQTPGGPFIKSHNAVNIAAAEAVVRQAAAAGAKLILVQELFSQPYFCQQQSSGWFSCAEPLETSEVVAWAVKLARELRVVLPTSFFEKKNNSYFNSIAMVDADGASNRAIPTNRPACRTARLPACLPACTVAFTVC